MQVTGGNKDTKEKGNKWTTLLFECVFASDELKGVVLNGFIFHPSSPWIQPLVKPECGTKL